MKLLLIEDQLEIQTTLERAFKRQHIHVTICGDGARALDRWQASVPDVVVLDLTLPGLDGLEVLAQARKAGLKTPVLVLTARGTIGDRILGLDTGADDYLPKPFEPRELAARLQTILRRSRNGTQGDAKAQKLVFEGLTIDLQRREVQREGELLDLTGTEFELLVLLAREPGRVFTRDEILNRLRGREADLYTRAVDILVSRLRKKLEPLPLIKTLRNAGYTFAGVPRT